MSDMIKDEVEAYFSNRPTFKVATVQGMRFNIASLSAEAVEDIGACESYAEILNYAADNGLAFMRNRVSDNEDKKLDIPDFWAQDKYSTSTDEDKTIRQLVGEEVCAISDIAEMLSEQLKKDAEKVKEDDDVDSTETTNDINAVNNAHR